MLSVSLLFDNTFQGPYIALTGIMLLNEKEKEKWITHRSSRERLLRLRGKFRKKAS